MENFKAIISNFLMSDKKIMITNLTRKTMIIGRVFSKTLGIITSDLINKRIDFQQFICLGPKGCKLLKINSSFRNEAKID